MDLVAADAVAVGLAWLQQHPAVLAELAQYGGDATNVSGEVVPPYPRLTLQARPGTPKDLRTGISAQDVRLTAWSTRESDPGEAALRRLLIIAEQALAELPDQPYGPADPVITFVVENLPEQPIPDPGGRGRMDVGLRIFLHPPVVSPSP